jgi:acetyltransferase-like isoleucine patch superfamily enzyme
MEFYRDKSKDIFIQAKELCIGRNVFFGGCIYVDVKGIFHIGDRSRLGNDVKIEGRNISIGSDLYHSEGLRIGGGGYTNPTANFSIGDRCTIHNNYINIAEPVVIGNDVGLSPDVTIQTHGYWLSVLGGFPAKFGGVIIDDGAIIGYRSMILMGVHIHKNIVIGANSVVTKSLTSTNSIYAGNPARFIRKVVSLSKKERVKVIDYIISKYKEIATYHEINPNITINYPYIHVNKCKFDVEKLEFFGEEDKETDDFRDYVRKWGLRFYSDRPFKCVYK